MDTNTLAAYVLTAMIAWVKPETHASFEPKEATLARYDSIAHDIALTVQDPDEGIEEDKQVPFALMLASIAGLESDYAARVDDGRVTGDHGTAFCIMQIRPALGITMEDHYYNYAVRKPKAWREEHASEIIHGRDLVGDRRVCLRVGLHMSRDSIRAVGHLGVYTGETKEGPKAKHRLERAKAWFKSHKP